jgi:stage IV sporulation protein FB
VFSLFDYSGGGHGEWRFQIFDVPVRVQPWFWLTVALSAAGRETGDALIWIGVCFVSILLHELGHVAAFRLFGIRAQAVLYAWGGLAVPEQAWRMNALAETIICVAGPLTGFSLAALVAAAAQLAGAKFALGFHLFVIPSVSAILPRAPVLSDPRALQLWRYSNVLVNDLLSVNLYWGLLNLVPVYPLDGGQAARAILEEAHPGRGRGRALLTSAMTGAVVVVLGMAVQSTYIIFLFGCLAAASTTELAALRPLFPRKPYTSSHDGGR